MWRHLEVFPYALVILWLKLLVNLSHIIRIVVLTMKNHHKSAEFWAQSEEAGGTADGLV